MQKNKNKNKPPMAKNILREDSACPKQNRCFIFIYFYMGALQRFTCPFLALRVLDDVPTVIGPDSKDGSVFALFNLSFHFQYYSLHANTFQNVKKMFPSL